MRTPNRSRAPTWHALNIVEKVEQLISSDELGLEGSAKHDYLRLKRANKVKGKLFNKQQLIKYGKA